MNPGSGSALSDSSQCPLPDASKVPSYVNLARCVSGYTSLTSYTSPVRREYSPARREFTPVNGRSRRDFSPAPSHHVSIGPAFNSTGSALNYNPTNRRDPSLSRVDNKENPGAVPFGAMYSHPLSTSKYTAQGQSGESSDSNGRAYLKLSMLDNYNNTSPTRSSRTPYRPPLHLPKSPGHSPHEVMKSGDSRTANGRETRMLKECGPNGTGDSWTLVSNGNRREFGQNGTGDYWTLGTNGDRNGGSSPDAVDSDIRRRVELLEKASCKNLPYNINRASRSPKDGRIVQNPSENDQTYPKRNLVSDIQVVSEKEVVTLDSDGGERGSPIPVMKLLNPEFRAMLGKTAKISPNKQFVNEFGTKEASPLVKTNERFNETNGTKNINLKTILTHEPNGNAADKVVNINVIVNKNVNKNLDLNVTGPVRDLIEDVSNGDAQMNGDVWNCQNNNVQRHRDVIENNINATMNLTNERNVNRIQNDLDRDSSGDSREGSKERDVLVKQINAPALNVKDISVKDNIEKSKREQIIRDNNRAVNSIEKPISRLEMETQKIDNNSDGLNRIALRPNNFEANDSHSKDNELNELSDSPSGDDAFNGNLVQAKNAKNLDAKKTLCRTFIDTEKAFMSLTSDMPSSESFDSVNKPADTLPNVDSRAEKTETPLLLPSSSETSTVSSMPQGSAECPIPKHKTDSNEQNPINVCKTAALGEDSLDSTASESQVKDGVYYKQLLDDQREVLVRFLSSFESVLTDLERNSDCTDSGNPCDSSESAEASKLSSEIEGQILLTVGQCKLLLNKKFPFFEKNCDKSLLQAATPVDPDSGELQILNADLTGLWDTMCIQIDEVREKFESLSRLRENEWVGDASHGASAAAQFAEIPKMASLKSGNMKRSSLGTNGQRKKTIPRGLGSKSTSALPVATNAVKKDERKRFLEEKRKAMMAERRKEMKKTGGESEDTAEDLVQFL